MACESVESWSLIGLVAAFLDLAIAFLLLCASAAAYLASNFLGFLGLNLPCPCDGMFINNHSKDFCFNSLLIDFPTQKVSDVHLSVKQKFPFSDFKWVRKCGCSIGDDDSLNRILEIEGEASSGRFDLKGKGVLSHRPKSRLRNRRGGADHGKNSKLLCYDPPLPEDDNKALKRTRGRQRAIASVEINESQDEDLQVKKTIQSIEELQDNQQGVQSIGGDEKNTIRLLEQKLEEEHIARAALYIELEKERSAAATAADEAMAMILRLQEEKASIQMEARQYQRILEEKSAYDAEEMIILKEILVRREMEKHFLEKEVETYRQMVSMGNAQLAGDGSHKSDARQDFGPLVDSDDDLQHQPGACSDRTVTENESSNENSGGLPVCSSSGNMDLQEKEIIIADDNVQLTSKAPQESEQVQEMNNDHKITKKIIATCNGTEIGDQNFDESLKQKEKNSSFDFSSCDQMLEKDCHVYDVHIVGHGMNCSSEATEDKSDGYSVPSTSRLVTEAGLNRSSSEITCGLPPIGPRGLSLVTGLRRNSTSAMDSEMLTIDSEIGRLQERLKLDQEGREKIGLTSENQERENLQLKLLEDIARQIQEIRSLTDPGNAAQHVSFPYPTSKALSKKRRSRSVSSGLPISCEGRYAERKCREFLES